MCKCSKCGKKIKESHQSWALKSLTEGYCEECAKEEDEKDLELEHLFLGFRSCVGVEMTKIPNKQNLAVLLQEKILEQRGNRVFAKDYFLGDEIALFVS